MWSSFKGFLYRHRRKFFITGALFGGSYIFYRYVKWRLLEWQRQQENAYLAQARKQHHFESNQRTCSITLFSLLPNLRDALVQKLNCEEITGQLREKPINKLELWGSLKVLSFTRTVSAIYSSCFLFVFLHVQLNVIGGYMYIDSMLSCDDQATSDQGGHKKAYVGENLQKKYLALVKYLLEEGLDLLITEVERCIEDVLGDVSLKEKFNHAELARLVNHVRQSVEFSQHSSPLSQSSSPNGIKCRPFSKFMIPPDLKSALDDSEDDEKLEQLYEETLDVLESKDCCAVLKSCLEAGFSHLADNIFPFFLPDEQDLLHNSSSTFTLHQSLDLPLAKIIPIINGQVNHLFSDMDNSYIDDLYSLACIRDFAANVYEAFSHEGV